MGSREYVCDSRGSVGYSSEVEEAPLEGMQENGGQGEALPEGMQEVRAQEEADVVLLNAIKGD